MNIFILDPDPAIAAVSQCDKHIVKMPLETAQMLCTALSGYVEETRYRPTHRNHPCTLWAGQSRANFMWLVQHGYALSSEYTRRYGRRHKSEDVIDWAHGHRHLIPIAGGQTDFVQAMPDEYRGDCAISAYRAYYIGEKSSIAAWKISSATPDWWPVA